MSSTLPDKQQALVLESVGADFKLKTVPVAECSQGSAIVQILSAQILSYHRDIYQGKRGLKFPTPLVGGSSAVGRVVAIGDDATSLTIDQLVYVDCVFRGRDNPDVLFLSAIHEGASEGSKKLMRDVWRDGAFAQYVRAPLENCEALNESKLVQQLGYSIASLSYMAYLLVPFGGMRDIRLEVGETIVISPATGAFGGAAVQVAIALGARVIAMGRNWKELERVKGKVECCTNNARIQIVQISGDEATDTAHLQNLGPVDAVLDLTPPHAFHSTHLRSAIASLRPGGRVSLMGFADISASMWHIVGSNITLKGRLMYTREDIKLLIKMLERGIFPAGNQLVDTKVFRLDQWKEALDEATTHTGMGRAVVFVPQSIP